MVSAKQRQDESMIRKLCLEKSRFWNPGVSAKKERGKKDRRFRPHSEDRKNQSLRVKST